MQLKTVNELEIGKCYTANNKPNSVFLFLGVPTLIEAINEAGTVVYTNKSGERLFIENRDEIIANDEITRYFIEAIEQRYVIKIMADEKIRISFNANQAKYSEVV